MRFTRLFIVFSPFAICTVVAAESPVVRPNNMFFPADDLGQRDLGCYGSTFYETPHLDRLARDGARVTDASPPAPVSKRAFLHARSFMSGVNPITK